MKSDETGSNQRGAGNGAIALRFHGGQRERAVTDHERWALTMRCTVCNG